MANINIEKEKIARLKSWMDGVPKGPLSIHMDPSNRCNIRCKFCWMRSHEKLGLVDTSNELPDEQFIGLAKESYELGVREWLLSGGGEPLIRGKAAIELMKEIKRYGMHGDIITNGLLFKEEDIAELVKLGWNRIRVSITGPNPRIHDTLVEKKGAFEIAIKNLRLFSYYKKKFKTDLPELGFNTVISSLNYKYFPEMIRLLHSVGGCLINIQSIILYSEHEKRWALDLRQRKELPVYLKKAIALCDRYRIATNMRNYLNKELVKSSNEVGKMTDIMIVDDGFLGSHCYEQWYLMTIRANGIVGSCRLFGDKGDSLHNRSLKDVWYGEYFQNARKRLLNKEIFDYCKNCSTNEFMQNQWIKGELTRLVQNGNNN